VTGVEQLEARLLFARPLGVDVAHYQGTINWTTLAANKQFAYIKGTGSDAGNYLDSTFTTNANNARSAGMIFGTYHFAYPASSTDAVAQADYMIAHSGIAMENGNLPPVLDLERGSTDPTTISNWANAFCYRIYARLGVKPIIYSSSGTYASYVNSSVTSNWKLWVANYGATDGTYTDSSMAVMSGGPSSTGNWSTWTMWQYNSVGNVPGIGTEPADSDVYNGTLQQLQALEISGQAIVKNGSTYIASGGGTDVKGNAIVQNYGTVGYNSTAPTMTFTIQNEGTPAITLGNLTVPSGYTIIDGLNETSLPSLGSDTITVQMNTNVAGTFAGNITFTTSDPDTPTFKIPITGKVNTAPQVAVKNGATTISNGQSNAVSFGTAERGGAGPSITFTVSNAGGTALTTSGLTVPSGYTVTDGLASSIAAGGSDTVTLQLNTASTGTFAGNVSFTNNVTGQSPFTFPITGTVVDTTPPTLTGGSLNDDQLPITISFQFSEPIQPLSASNLVITNLDGGAAPSVSGYNFSNGSGTFTLNGGLVDGHFRATLNGVKDLAGNSLSGANALAFTFLTADSNRDGTVDSSDFVTVASHFGMSGNLRFSDGDFNYDGVINALDFNALASRYGQSILPAASSLVTDPGAGGASVLSQPATPANLFSADPIRAQQDPLLISPGAGLL